MWIIAGTGVQRSIVTGGMSRSIDATGAIDPARARQAAGLVRRLGAMVYDAMMVFAALMVVTMVVSLLPPGREIPAGTLWFQLLLLATAVLFHCGFWTHGGQTIGMLAWRIRVERYDGSPLRWRDALLRYAAAILSAVPLGLGYWWSLFDADKLAWHDRLSRTRLVRV